MFRQIIANNRAGWRKLKGGADTAHDQGAGQTLGLG
jgi:hypothetical protein